MKKLIAIFTLLLSACGSQPAPTVQASSYAGWSEEALDCCECLEQTGCYVTPQTKLEPLCRPAIDSGETPNAIASCLAGEPGSYPQGLCVDACAVLF